MLWNNGGGKLDGNGHSSWMGVLALLCPSIALFALFASADLVWRRLSIIDSDLEGYVRCHINF